MNEPVLGIPNVPGDSGPEFAPWVITYVTSGVMQLAMWRIADNGQLALAMFSDRDLAETYAEQVIVEPPELTQVEDMRLLALLAECYKNRIEYAVLNPNRETTRQLFVLKDVLRAGKNSLAGRKSP